MATSLSIDSASNLPIKTTSAREIAQDRLGVGVIGYGYWGPNIVRNFHGQEHSKVIAVCDEESQFLRRVQQSHADIRLTSDFEDLLTSLGIDIIAVVTPVWLTLHWLKPPWKTASTFLWKAVYLHNRAGRRADRTG